MTIIKQNNTLWVQDRDAGYSELNDNIINHHLQYGELIIEGEYEEPAEDGLKVNVNDAIVVKAVVETINNKSNRLLKDIDSGIEIQAKLTRYAIEKSKDNGDPVIISSGDKLLLDIDTIIIKRDSDIATIDVNNVDFYNLMNHDMLTLSSLDSVIVEVMNQAGINKNDLSESDYKILYIYSTKSIVGTLTGSYPTVPTGRDLYDSLDGFIGDEPMEIVINAAMIARIKYDAEKDLFIAS